MLNKYEYRCKNCRKLLAKGDLKNGTAEIKCGKCGHLNCFTSKAEAEKEPSKKL